MSDVTDSERTHCAACGGGPGGIYAVPIIERPIVRLQLNGPGGVFSSAILVNGTRIRAGFGKDAGALAEIPQAYQITHDPKPGTRFVAYMNFWVQEEPIPQE